MKYLSQNLKLLTLIFCVATLAKAQINTPTGASIPFGTNASYQFGILPTNLNATDTDVAAEYTNWKTNYVENCGTTMARVKFDETANTVSEGIAYGMLLSAYAGDKDLFNRLWAYYKNFRNSNGVMHWKITGCNSVNQQNGATDAELDAAMALIVANKQWPNTTSPHNYVADGTALINAIKNTETSNDGTFFNGDMWHPDCRNPSYQAPAYARVFKTFMANAGINQDAFWNNVAAKTEILLAANAHSVSGLNTNWCTPAGPPSSACSGSGTAPDKFGYDACRAPWRQAIDVLWYGPVAAAPVQTVVNRAIDFWITKGAANVQGSNTMNWDGTGSGDKNCAYWGPVGAQSLAASNTAAHQTFANAMFTQNKINTGATGYFTKILQVIGLFVQSGNFWDPYAVASPPINTLTVSATAVSLDASASTSSSISVTSNQSWAVSVDQSWLSTSATSGTNDGSFTIITIVNTGAARTGTVTVSGGGIVKTITVSQAAVSPPINTLTVSATAVSLDASASTSSSISVTSNQSWAVSVDQSWLSTSVASGTNDGSFTITASANTGTARTGTVTVSGGGIIRTITVSQAAASTPVNTLTVSISSLNLIALSSTSSSISVTSNQSWTVADNQTWLSTSVASGTNNGSFTITASANTGTARSGSVTVSGGGIVRTITVSQAAVANSSRTFIVRARGTSAGAQLQLRVNNTIITTWNLTTTMANYTIASSAVGTVRVQFANDATNRDIQVDNLKVNAITYQAENQTINTSFYSNGRCGGGGKSEMMHCNGYIEFAGSSAARIGSEVNFENEENSDELIVFPSPSPNGNFTILLDRPDANIQVYSLLGEKLIDIQNHGKKQIEVQSNLKSGMYIIKAQSESNIRFKKLIIQ